MIIHEKKANVNKDQKLTQNTNYIKAPIDKFGYYGRWFRHKLLDGILVGTPVLLTIQQHRTPLRTKFMKFLSFLGTEDFYTVLLLFLMWMIDCRLGRLFGVLLAVGFYTTGSLKTLFCLPRPPSPPIQPLEDAYDWALPSHHSLLGVICPWYIWLYVNLHYELSPLEMGFLGCLIVLWSFGVMLSRLYLGVHSPADIVCGGIVGVLVLSIWMQIDDFVDFYISQRIELQVKMFAAVFFLLLFHPHSERGNPSYPDTCTVMGVFFGIVLGRSLRHRSRGWPTVLDVNPDISALEFLKSTFSRLIVGGLTIIIVKVIAKIFTKAIFSQVFRFCGYSTYSGKNYRKNFPVNKHFTSKFVIPPISQIKDEKDEVKDNERKQSSSKEAKRDSADNSANTQPFTTWLLGWSLFKEDWDIDIPVNIVVYTIITYVAVEVSPQIFFHINI